MTSWLFRNGLICKLLFSVVKRERERKFKVVIVIFCIFLLWDSRVWTWWGLKVLKESIKIADVPGIRPLFNKSLKITSFLSHWPLLLLQPTPDNSEPSLTRMSRLLGPKSSSPEFSSKIYCNFTLDNSNHVLQRANKVRSTELISAVSILCPDHS